MIAARMLTRKKISTISTSTMPRSRLRLDGVGGEVDQVAAIVVGMDLYVRGQDLLVQFFGLGFDAFRARSVSARRGA